MANSKIKLGIVGVGKIVRDQHLPSIDKNGSYELVATASRNASVDGIASFKTIQEMLDAVPELDAVALCMPPQYRQAAAHLALARGKHVLLEKPPGATVSEVEQLADLAQLKGVSLYATWHSRHGAAVEKAKIELNDAHITSVNVVWKEDVRKWHPGQDWIWQAGGLGVFDPGINGLSILTYILPQAVFVSGASLSFPANKAAPIAAEIDFQTTDGLKINAVFDWRVSGDEEWAIELQTSSGELSLSEGGGALSINGVSVEIADYSEHGEYEAIYARFAEIIQGQQSDVDLAPLKLVADAFLLGDRKTVDAFKE